MVRTTGSGISHCPNSNFSLKSGVCNVQRLRRAGVKVSNSDARLIKADIWDEHDQLSRWVLERTVLEDSHPPFWTQCVKQLLLQMLYTSLERRTLHFHLGWIFSSFLRQSFPHCSDALYLATRGSAKVLDKEGELGLLEGGAVADFLLVDMNGE